MYSLIFYSMIQNQFQTKIQIISTDRDMAYFNYTLQDYIKKNWIIYQSYCVETPQQNRAIKRKSRNSKLLES